MDDDWGYSHELGTPRLLRRDQATLTASWRGPSLGHGARGFTSRANHQCLDVDEFRGGLEDEMFTFRFVWVSK